MLLHPTQETLCELQWNPETERIEIAFRLALGDEERLLKEAEATLKKLRAKRSNSDSKSAVDSSSVDGDESAIEFSPHQLAFGRHMTFANDDACVPESTVVNAANYRWVGRREEGIHVWWFAEYVVSADEQAKATPPSHVRCDLFVDTARNTVHPTGHGPHDAFQNTFVILGHPVPVSAVVTPRDPVAELNWPE
ncbi:MAG: hypothetical protein ACF8AM_03815 [Rhodopirellula sp. JB055]|uniref:hypothetical protein n=1 Tax=Rhodopirellula sp. JB055 TaxID=3342846 RepID=UPI00370B9803